MSTEREPLREHGPDYRVYVTNADGSRTYTGETFNPTTGTFGTAPVLDTMRDCVNGVRHDSPPPLRSCRGWISGGRRCSCADFAAVDLPEPHEVASALVVTEWTCPYPECGAENDVWGEGAIHSWMECPSCGTQSYLRMDGDRR